MSKKLSILDLTPQSVEFNLSTVKETLVLKPWSLRVKAWAVEKYGAGNLKSIIEKMQTVQIGEITFFMLTDESKAIFKTVDNYFDSIQSTRDELAVHKALLKSMGIGEPEIEELANLVVEAAELPDPKTLAPSDNPLP